MAEQQLVDYIKKAKSAGQSDDQSRALLLKNGWTEAEVSDAFAVLGQPQSKPQPQVQPQTQPQAQVQQQPQYQPKPQPQYQPQPSGMATQSNMPSPSQISRSETSEGKLRSGSHLILKLFIVLIILAVLGGVGYFTAGQYLNLPYSNILGNLFAPSPESVISNMLAKMKDVKSYHTVTQGDVSVKDNNKISQGKLSFSITGGSDMTSATSPKANFTISFSAVSGPSATPLATASVDMIVAGDTVVYLKVNDLITPDSAIDLAQIKGAWLKIDQDSIKALSTVEGGELGITIPQTSDNAAMVKKIQDLLSTENMISVDKQLADEIVSGQSTYHYSVIINKTKIKDLLTKVMAMQAQAENGAAANPLVQNITGALITTLVDAIGDINMELWVGKKDYMLYRFKIDKTIDLNKISQGANMTLAAKLDVTNSNFGKTISVQAPAEAQKIEDVVLPLIKTQGVSSDIHQIGFLAKSIFNADQSYLTFCNRGLLNGYQGDYGADLINLNNKIVAQGAKKPACFSDAQDFCVSTQLADGSYLCIDKNGAIQNSKCTSAKDSCLPSL